MTGHASNGRLTDIISLILYNPEGFQLLSDHKKKPWEQSLGQFLEDVVARNSGKTFIEIGGQSKSYQEFYDGVRKAAAMFADLGIRREDRVCLFLPNCIEYVYSWFGLSLIGAISVPVNTAYKRDEMAYILNNAEAKGLVTDPSLIDVAGAAAELAPSVNVRLLQGLTGTLPDGWVDYSKAHHAVEPLGDLPDVSPDDVSMLVYTSGTTGNPQGVMCTHLMYVAAGQGFAHWTEATSEDRFFTCLPYYHANIQYYSTMGALASGGTLVVVDRFSASRFWGQVREAHATVVNFIGMMMPVLSTNEPASDDKDNTVRLF